MSRKSIVLVLGLALSAFAIGPVYSLQQPLVNVCATPPALNNPENEYTPKPGVGVTTWKFAPGVTHNSWEDTRVSVASSSLNLFDWKIGRTRIPGFLSPYQSVIDNNAAVAINSDFFNLWGDPLPWGPALEDGELVYFPLAYEPQSGYSPDWIKVVGVVSRVPDPADGWTTSGSVQLDGNPQIIAGLNLPALPLDGVVVYDNRRNKTTPTGEASLLISENKIIDFDLAGKSYSPEAGQIAVQATGNAAKNLRSRFSGREVTLDLGNPETHGFLTTGSVTSGKVSAKFFAVNKAVARSTVFTTSWTGPTIKKALTWVIANGKVKQIFPKGSAVEVSPNQYVLQFASPSKAIRAIKSGAKVKVSYTKPTAAKGFLTDGSAHIGSSNFSISGINKTTGSNEITLFTNDWDGRTPAGALTLVIKNGLITSLYNEGRSLTVAEGEYVLQVPALIAPDIRTAFTGPNATVIVDETLERIKTIAETKARIRSSLTVNGEKLYLGTLNYYQAEGNGSYAPDPDKGAVYDDNWRGSNGDGATIAGSASVRVRNGVIQKINKSGGSMSVSESGDLVFQFGYNQAPLVQDWTVGMPATYVSKYQTKNDEPYETFLGYGTRLITDGSVVADCSNAGDQVRPRTAIGWNDAGQYWLITASPASRDPSNSGYRTGGANYPQLARWLKSLGATHAVAVDGGGSTWMVRRTTSGATRVDLPDADGNDNPWIRWVPFNLMLVPASE